MNYDEIKRLAEKYNVNMIYLKIEGDSNNKDIKNSKALSLFNNIKKWINNIGFKIFNYYYFFDENYLYGYILYYPDKLPEYEIREGPLLWEEKNYNKFYEKHKNEELIIRNGKIYAVTKRKINDIYKALEFIINSYKNSIRKKAKYLYIKIGEKEIEIKY